MILQRRLPFDPSHRALPGVQPLDMADWLIVDDAYAGQMALRGQLLSERRAAVLAMDPDALPAARELLAMLLDHLPAGFTRTGGLVTCPDGRQVAIDPDRPLETANALVQEDLCLMERRGKEHVLTAALLCFPASWMLAEKFMRPLTAIHDPVPEYDADIARRVQRLFDGVRPGRPIWRSNALWYADPNLHQPRSVHDRRPDQNARVGDYFRSERQTILRLPETDAVAFTIHTFIVARADMETRSKVDTAS